MSQYDSGSEQVPDSPAPDAAVGISSTTTAASAASAAPTVLGAPASKTARMSTMTKSLTAVGVAAVIAVGGTIAVTSASAATAGAAQLPSGYGASSTGGADGTVRGGGGGLPGARGPIGTALHGEFVASDPAAATTAGGTTATIVERMQAGSVTAVSATSITVKSTDNFSATYVVPSGLAVTAYSVGTKVMVLAKVSGSTVTLVSIHGPRPAGAAGDRDGFRGRGGPGAEGRVPGATPPSGTGTSGAPSTATTKPTI